jgi:hypothetical protein
VAFKKPNEDVRLDPKRGHDMGESMTKRREVFS